MTIKKKINAFCKKMHQSEPSISKRRGGYYFYLGKLAWNRMDFQTLTYAQRNFREPLSSPCQWEEARNEIHGMSARLRHQTWGGRRIKSDPLLTFREASRWLLRLTCGGLNRFFSKFFPLCVEDPLFQSHAWIVRLPRPQGFCCALHFSLLQLLN